jgi:sulfate adenylyltransferase subunit 2
MKTRSNTLDELNARRRHAVELRLAGTTVSAVCAQTGLSAPTIIAAHKAFLAGGWAAVTVKALGRTKGLGRVLSAQQETMILRDLCHAHPQAPSLWTLERVGKHVEAVLQAAVSHSSLQRYLQRWQLHWPPLHTCAQASPEGRLWLQTEWPAIQQQAQRAHEHLVWCSVWRHPDTGATLLVAQDLRGRAAWMAAPALADVRSYTAFAERLLETWPGRTCLLLHGPDLNHPNFRGAWPSPTQLRVLSCPVALPATATPTRHRPSSSPAAPPVGATAPQAPRQEAGTPLAAANTPLPLPARLSPTTHTPLPKVPVMTSSQTLTHLQRLEAESIHIFREVVAECEKPVMLYSIGKDSACMLHLARKAFYPAPPPFPLLHVDTTWKFRDMYAMRERMPKEAGMDLLVWQNPEAKRLGINPFDHGSQIHTDMWKTQGLKQALDHYGFDAAFGGARRDEEKSRAKERVFSFRSAQHRWDPKQQRPELWHLYNARKNRGESIRVFPLSNWTELDIWQYIYLENIPIVPLYFAQERPVVERDGTLIMVDDQRMPMRAGEVPVMRKVRFRTLGCYPLSGAIESEADTLTSIIQEMLLARTSERQGRLIDHDQAASMEKKKQEGYF